MVYRGNISKGVEMIYLLICVSISNAVFLLWVVTLTREIDSLEEAYRFIAGKVTDNKESINKINELKKPKTSLKDKIKKREEKNITQGW